jgi:ferric-dicitrate binding protein FerR (iron transport regulator)
MVVISIKAAKMETRENKNVDWMLLTAYISGNISETDRQYIENWLKESEVNRETLQKATKVWEASKNAAFADIDVDNAWSKVNSKARITKPRNFSLQTNYSKYILRIAAVLVIGLVSWFIFSNINSEKTTLAKNAVVPVVLSDGSEITLNKESKLVYPKHFSSNSREVELVKGMAFFNIAKNPHKPFIITTRDTRIKVLGTSFNVGTSENGDVEVIVRSGIVSFESENTLQKVTLYKNEKAIYNAQEGTIEKGLNSDPNYLSWKTKKFEFRATSLGQVFSMLQDIYGISIQIKDPAINNCHYTGKFDNDDIEHIFNVIDKTMGLTTVKSENTYTVGGNCKEQK